MRYLMIICVALMLTAGMAQPQARRKSSRVGSNGRCGRRNKRHLADCACFRPGGGRTERRSAAFDHAKQFRVKPKRFS